MDGIGKAVRAWKQARKLHMQVDLHLPHVRNMAWRRMCLMRRQSEAMFQTTQPRKVRP